MDTHLVWVVGRSGLLGRALDRHLAGSAGTRLFAGARVPWDDAPAAVQTLCEDLDRFLAAADGGRWSIFWAAGAGVIGSDPSLFERETAVLDGLVRALAARACSGRGAFFLASSASVYAGHRLGPYDESTVPAPTSAYARAKLANEQVTSAALSGRLPHVLGRISTLFGPGQDLTKNQGLVSKLCLQAVRRQTVQVFAPLDTLRDYLYVDDAAKLAAAFLARAEDDGDLSSRVRHLSHGSALSIGALTALVRQISHRRAGELHVPPVDTAAHVRDLRVVSRYAHEVVGARRTTHEAGIRATYADVLACYLRGDLAEVP